VTSAAVSTAYSRRPVRSRLAALILMRLKDPHRPQRGTVDNDSAATMTAQLAVELQDRVTINGTDGIVERIGAGDRAPAGRTTTTTLIVSKRSRPSRLSRSASRAGRSRSTTGDYIAA